MKMSFYPKKKINIYSSEMSPETVESYEKYYKNLNECTNIDSELHEDVNRLFENKEKDLCHDTTTNLINSMENDNHNNDSERKRVSIEVTENADLTPNKKRKKEFEPPKLQEDNRDIFCWRCHKYVGIVDVLLCYFCPRVFHLKCAHIQEKPSTFWLCTECDAISTAENPDKISPALSKLQKNDLAELLMYVMKRMRQHEGSSHFEKPVDADSYPDYKDYIVKPMCLSLLEHNVKNLKYASCESFLADTKWMVHNSYIFNTVHSELTLYAKALMKNAKHECEEIINCPDCYLHANTLEEDKWFIEPCEKPHILVWARLKGFPYWPCKVMKANGTTVDVRFFGDHNKSLVPVDCCYLYSKQMPSKQKKVDELEVAITEAGFHIKRLEEKYHVFQYAPLKILYNPKEEDEQRKLLLPYHDKPFFIRVKDKEKLFGPQAVRNVSEEPLAYSNNAYKVEDKKKTTLELPNEVEINIKKNIIRNQSEDISSYRPSLNNKNISPSPLVKPTIIIEDNDSNILSQNSYNIPKQNSVRFCEKFNSSHTINKSGPSPIEKQVVSTLIQTKINENDNGTIGIHKNTDLVQCTINSPISDTNHSNCSNLAEENSKSLNVFKDNNLSPEKTKNGEKPIIATVDKLNNRSTSNSYLDKSNNNLISDKLRISSNAKLINALNNNPALINNYIFKPMVIVQKLRDDVYRDYSSNIRRKTEPIIENKLDTSTKNNVKKKITRDNQDANLLNFDLLNGNITNLVSMTEIDLDKDDSSIKLNLSINKEAENFDKCNSLRATNGLKSLNRSVKPFIKSENVEEDDVVDKEYIEKLSKSILESTFDYSDDNENGIQNKSICDFTVENRSCINHSSLEGKDSISTEDEPISNSTTFNAQNILTDEEISTDSRTKKYDEGAEKLNNKNCSNSELFEEEETSLTQENVIKNGEATITLLKQEDNANEKNYEINLTANENHSKGVDKNTSFDLVEKNKNDSSLKKIEITFSDEKREKVNCIKNVENKNSMEGIQEESQKNVDEFNIPGIKSCDNADVVDSPLNERFTATMPVLQNNEIINKEKIDSVTNQNSDCEIVNIIFPENTRQTLKPIGYKNVNTSGRIIKKAIKKSVLLPTCRKRQNYNMSLKKHNSSSKSRPSDKGIKCSNSNVRNQSTTVLQQDNNKQFFNLKNVVECGLNEVDENKKLKEEDKMMALEIDSILNKIGKNDSREDIKEILTEELKKFENHCKKKIETYQKSYIEEMDSLYTMEKERWIQESINVCENESRMMIDEIKKKQWCILCLNEAKFHCCWSTSYCSEKCQVADWPIHVKTCTQYTMRAGDPDLRLSPEFRKILHGRPEVVRDFKIKDIIDSIENQAKVSATMYPTTSNNNNLISSKSTSPKSIVHVPKHALMNQDISQETNEASRTQLMNIYSNPGVYISGITAPPNQNKSIIHIPKKNSINLSSTLHKDQISSGTGSYNKPLVCTVPLPNKNNTLVPIAKAFTSSGSMNKNIFNNNNHAVVMGGQQFILPKSCFPTKVIKKSVPIVAPKKVENTTVIKTKSLYISLPNGASMDISQNADGFTTKQLAQKKIKMLKEPSVLLKEALEHNSMSNRDITKSAQPFLIVEKSGETSQYTCRIGFQENLVKVNPPVVEGQTVSPLSSTLISSNPSTSVETDSTPATF